MMRLNSARRDASWLRPNIMRGNLFARAQGEERDAPLSPSDLEFDLSARVIEERPPPYAQHYCNAAVVGGPVALA